MRPDLNRGDTALLSLPGGAVREVKIMAVKQVVFSWNWEAFVTDGKTLWVTPVSFVERKSVGGSAGTLRGSTVVTGSDAATTPVTAGPRLNVGGRELGSQTCRVVGDDAALTSPPSSPGLVGEERSALGLGEAASEVDAVSPPVSSPTPSLEGLA